MNLREKLHVSENDYKVIEEEYNQSQASYNEFNLLVTRQHSKINALTQSWSSRVTS
jgi:chromosome segregation protein